VLLSWLKLALGETWSLSAPSTARQNIALSSCTMKKFSKSHARL